MKYGGTCTIGSENRKMINRLISEGYRQDDSIKYKLCEANGEMILIADLYLKGIEIPTHVRSEPRIKVHGRYIYEDGLWQKIESTWWTAS
jgi:hypothetical protein